MPTNINKTQLSNFWTDNNNTTWVNSLYIAEITEKQHRNIIRDIRHMIDENEDFGKSNFVLSSYDVPLNIGGTRGYNFYWLSEDGSSVLLGGYSIAHRIKVQNELKKYKDKAKELTLPSYQIDNPIERAKVWIKEQEVYIKQLESAKEIIEEKEEIITELEPKAEKFDTFISSDDVQSIANVAKSLGLGRNKLYIALRDSKILMKNNLPYQKYIDSGYFVVKQSVIQRKTTSLVKQQTFVTTKGISFIFKCLNSQRLINVTKKLFQ